MDLARKKNTMLPSWIRKILSLNAISDIPKLPSGGTPKTDVLLKIKTADGIINNTFSCTRSSSKWTSVHKYTVSEYIEECKRQDVQGQSQILFKRAYPSGGKGKRK